MGVSLALGTFQTLLFARVLSPEGFGYYGIALTIAGYGAVFQFGILSGLTRELPVSIGARDFERATRLAGETAVALAVASATMLPLFLLAVFLLADFSNPGLQTAAAMAGVLTASRSFGGFVLLRMRSERDVVGFPVAMIAQRVVTAAAGTVAAYYFGFVALLWVFVAVELATFAVGTVVRLRPLNYSDVRLADIRYLVGIGMPVMLAGVLRSVQLSVEKLFLLAVASAQVVGVYQVAWIPVALGIAASGIVSQYAGPKLLTEYGAHGSVRKVFGQSLKISGAIIVIGLAAAPVVYLAGEAGIRMWLPQYIESLPAFRILYIGAVLVAASTSNFAVSAANRQRIMLYAQVTSTVITLLAYAVLIQFTNDILWFAVVNVGSITTDFVIRLGFNYYVMRRYS